jgi:hypothetical protein
LHSQQECELEKAEEQNSNAQSTMSWEGFDGSSWVEQNSYQESSNDAPQLTSPLTYVSVCAVLFLLSSL